MPCYSRYEDGGNVFVKGRLGPKCVESTCNWWSDYLCDYPVGDGKTCDRRLCEDHAYQLGDDLHYCAAHYNAWVRAHNQSSAEVAGGELVPFKTV